jgi:hypothetical protein
MGQAESDFQSWPVDPTPCSWAGLHPSFSTTTGSPDGPYATITVYGPPERAGSNHRRWYTHEVYAQQTATCLMICLYSLYLRMDHVDTYKVY